MNQSAGVFFDFILKTFSSHGKRGEQVAGSVNTIKKVAVFHWQRGD
jgi:hypothetical protein